MEGSSVRGQQRPVIAQLNEAEDLQTFQSEIVRLIGAEFKDVDVFFAFFDNASRNLQGPAWIKSHLERHSALLKKLEQGEMVGINATEENPTPRPVDAARSSVLLIPLLTDRGLVAALGFICSLEGHQLSAEDIESARHIAFNAAPILSRLHQIDDLQREYQEQTSSLEATLRMRSHLQSNVAHELRTPLAAIRGYTRMILDGRGGTISDTHREYLRVVTENTNRLINLIGWMSYVGELSAQHFKLSRFDLRDAWNASVSASQPKMAEKSLVLSQRIPDEPFVLIGDREKLEYMLNEILGLAIRLADIGSTMTAELSHGREGEIHFKLVQKGAAIPADTLSTIFDRPYNAFTKLPAQTESGAINLSGVYDVVGMHGGRVFVNNTAGQGVTFLFTLPSVMAGEEKSNEQTVNSGRRRR